MAGTTAAADTRHSHSRAPRNSKSTWTLWNVPRVRAKSHATKRYLAVKRSQVTRVERIGPALFCAACSSVCSQLQLGQQPARTSDNMAGTARSYPIQKWRDGLTCTKTEKSSRI